jgi:hypothetical protein
MPKENMATKQKVKFEIKKGSFHIICSACWNLVLKSGYFKNKKSEIWQLFKFQDHGYENTKLPKFR